MAVFIYENDVIYQAGVKMLKYLTISLYLKYSWLCIRGACPSTFRCLMPKQLRNWVPVTQLMM